jgi:hypothetical protein
MSDITNVQEPKLPQPANVAGVTAANADLHRPGDHGHHKDEAAPDPVRCEATASAVPGAKLARAAHAADRAYRPARPIDRAWPFNPDDTSPLAWWRTLPPDRLGEAEALLVNTTLDSIDVMHGGDVAIALRGTVAAAVAVALALMPIAEVTLEVDLAMTAVLRAALAGDGPAALVLAHVLGHAEIGHPFATELSASWLTCHPRHYPAKRRFTKQEARLLAAMRERGELPAASVGGRA